MRTELGFAYFETCLVGMELLLSCENFSTLLFLFLAIVLHLSGRSWRLLWSKPSNTFWSKQFCVRLLTISNKLWSKQFCLRFLQLWVQFGFIMFSIDYTYIYSCLLSDFSCVAGRMSVDVLNSICFHLCMSIYIYQYWAFCLIIYD